MAEYQSIEYRIDNEGKIIEKVSNSSCFESVEISAPLETVLRKIKFQELLAQYYEDDKNLTYSNLRPDKPQNQGRGATREHGFWFLNCGLIDPDLL